MSTSSRQQQGFGRTAARLRLAISLACRCPPAFACSSALSRQTVGVSEGLVLTGKQLRPRWVAMQTGPAERLLALFMLQLSLVIVLPIPFIQAPSACLGHRPCSCHVCCLVAVACTFARTYAPAPALALAHWSGLCLWAWGSLLSSEHDARVHYLQQS